MSLVTIGEVRAIVESRLADDDLQALIDREEAWLASRIGALTGLRTVTFAPGLADSPIFLSRRTSTVVVSDAGVTLKPTDVRFTPESGVVRRVGAAYPWPDPLTYPWVAPWSGEVRVTFTPTDEADVKRAVLELVRGTLSETGFDAETMGDYGYTRGDAVARLSRPALVRSVLLRRPAYATRLRSSLEPT